jgi:hypothetical protein
MHISKTFLLATTALAIPTFADAKTVSFKVDMARYGGRGAYFAIYLTDPQGTYKGTLWLAGEKTRYYRHLSDWMAVTGGRPNDIFGPTGASIGSGRSREFVVDVPDALIDAGYTLRADFAAEEMWASPSEIVLPFTSDAQEASGRFYVSTFSYSAK